MKRSRKVSIVGVAALAAALTGCSDTPDYEEVQTPYGEICVRQPGDGILAGPMSEPVRVDDDNCERGGNGHLWVYIHQAGGHRAPAVGSKVTSGSYVTAKPTGANAFSRAPSSGGFGTFRANTGG